MVAKRNIPLKELKATSRANRQQVGKSVIAFQFTTLLHRPISIYFTKLFLMAGITSDTITLISYVFAVAAGVFFIFGNYWYSLIGIAIYQLFIILDCSDGDISRYMYGVNNNPRGAFSEDIGHSIIQPFIIICIAFGVYNNPNSLLVGSVFYQNLITLVIGFIGACLFLFLHVLDYYTKSKSSDTVSDEVLASPVKKHGPTQYLFAVLSRFRAWANKYTYGDLLLLVTVVSNTLWLYLILWGIIHLPLVVINGVMSYRGLPKPKVLEQETESEKDRA